MPTAVIIKGHSVSSAQNFSLTKFFIGVGRYMYTVDQEVSLLVQINNVISFCPTRKPSDWYKSITWSHSVRPGNLLIGPNQSRDLILSDQETFWFVQINHVTSFCPTRKPSDWSKSITWSHSVRPGSFLIGPNQSRDLILPERKLKFWSLTKLSVLF